MRIPKNYTVGFTLIYAALLAFCYVGMENNIYFWDTKGYWMAWENFSKVLFDQPLHALADIKHSIRHDDYNNSPVVILSLFSLLPLPSRYSYILGLVLIYLVPTVLCFSLLIRKVIECKNSWVTVLSYIFPLSFVAFWVPTLRGYPDICGLIFVLLSVIFCLKTDLSEKLDITKAFKLGIILWAPFLLRRWYAYTVVSLYLTLPILSAFYHENKISFIRIKNVILNFFVSGLISVVFALAFQWPLLKRIISTDYSYIYSAYQSSIFYSIESLVKNVGLVFCILALLSSIIILWKGSTKQRLCLALFVSNLIISFFLFTSTQSPGVQHNLPFSLWILLTVCLGLFWMVSKCKEKNSATVVSVCSIVFLLFCQFQSLFGVINKDFSPWLPNKNLPMRVENFSEYQSLMKDISKLTEDNKKVAVLSSSDVLNDDMLNTISEFKLTNRINYASQVDLRDGFKLQTLLSDYVIVTNPIQIHLNANGQRVITLPATEILNGVGIGKAYKRLDREYKLSAKVSAWIYKKERPFSLVEANEFLNKLYDFYPEWKDVYAKDIVTAYLSAEIHLGDQWGSFALDNNERIFAHPGENTPTVVKWNMVGIKKLRIDSISTSCNLNDNVIVNLSSTGSEVKTVYIPKGEGVVLDVTNFQNRPSVLEIKKNNSAGCDSLSIKQVD